MKATTLWAAVLILAAVEADCQSVREALMCEAKKRLSGWFEGGSQKFESPLSQDGVELRFMVGSRPCGGDDVPVMVANYSLDGVRPIHIFNALAHVELQKDWNPTMSEVKVLKDDAAAHVREVKLQYLTGVPGLPDRRIYEQEAFDVNDDGTEYWFAATSNNNENIKKLDSSAGSSGFFDFEAPVEANSCFAAHHVRATKTGVYVVFTNEVNGHPPFGLSPTLVSKLTWRKTVDFISLLQKEALRLAKEDDTKLWKLPFTNTPLSASDDGQCGGVLGLSEQIGHSILQQSSSSWGKGYLMLVAAGVLSAAAFVVARKKRSYRSQVVASRQLLVVPDDEDSEELLAA